MRLLLLGFIVGISLILSPLAVQFNVSVLMTVMALMLALSAMLILQFQRSQLLLQQLPVLKLTLLLITVIGSTGSGLGYTQWQMKRALDQRLTQPLERSAIVQVIGISDGVDAHWRQIVQEIKPQSSQQSGQYPKHRWLIYSSFDGQQGKKKPAPDMQPGQLWQIRVKLKPLHGYASAGAFDNEKWLLQQHIQATGTLQDARQLTAASIRQLQIDNAQLSFLDSIQQLRLDLRQHFSGFDSPARGVLLGLLTGDRSLIDKDTTQLYQQMGISHLLAISGPHVLLAALVIGWLWRQCLNCFPGLYLIMERPRWVLPVFILVVVAYALLAGFDIPAQRTVIMVFTVSVLQWGRQHWRNSSILLLTASILLLLDPLSVLSAAFWLSFGAVAILLALSRYSTQTLPVLADGKPMSLWQTGQQKVRQFILLQWRIFVLLMPLVIWCFAKLSWLSPVVNLIAIPLLGLVIVPLNLLGLIISSVSIDGADLIWQFGLHLLALFHTGLHYLALIFPKALQPFYLTTGQLVALWAGLVLLLIPKGVLPRWWLAFLLIPLLFPKRQHVPLTVQVIDVGQGLSVLLTTRQHSLLVDTGAKTPGFDVGEQVVLPALYARGVKRLDKLMLTHLDNDHSGGANAILRQMPVIQLTASQPFQQWPTHPCEAGQHWVWDGVLFKVLSPLSAEQAKMSVNENSCVLIVETPAHDNIAAQRILIMGDAGFYTEFLLQQQVQNLNADLLVLGHHGSKNSSSSAFLQAVKPRRAIVSAGYLNRYGHPDPVVLARLKEQGIVIDSTISSGTLTYQLGE